MLPRWEGGRAESCPQHKGGKSAVTWGIRAPLVPYKKYVAPSMMRVVMLGGYYRRRVCLEKGCDRGKNGAPLRWSTIELLPEGLIVPDVAECPRCESTKTIAKTL